MSGDPLQTLLRGCRGAAVAKWKSNNTSKSSSHEKTTTLAKELDFFGNTGGALKTNSATKEDVEKADFGDVIKDETLENALRKMAIVRLSPVQKRAIPLLREGHDVVAVAPTGSGKTLAYTLPVLQAVMQDRGQKSAPSAIVLAPTRELADQIGRVFTRVTDCAKLSLRLKIVCSKAAATGLKAGDGMIDVVIATPLRLIGAVKCGAVNLGNVRHIVLDEADQLFDEGFVEQIDEILAVSGTQLKDGARIHMFSATLPPQVETLSQGVLRNAKKVFVDAGAYGGAAAVNGVADSIEQKFMFVGGRGEQGKVFAVRSLLKEGLKPPILVFVQSKERAADLFRELVYDGVNVDAIHADRSQAARSSAIARFRSGKLWVLIATDVLARGIDFLCVNTIISYDMPSSATAYVHRIGRTGRNGRKGKAISLFTEEDSVLLPSILKVARASGAEVPEWATKLKGAGRRDVVKRLEKRPPTRKRVGGPNRASLPKRYKTEQQMAKRRERKAEKETQLGTEVEHTIEDGDEPKTSLEANASRSEDKGENNKWSRKRKKNKRALSSRVSVEISED